jgi:hypothetical protein
MTISVFGHHTNALQPVVYPYRLKLLGLISCNNAVYLVGNIADLTFSVVELQLSKLIVADKYTSAPRLFGSFSPVLKSFYLPAKNAGNILEASDNALSRTISST